MAFWSNSGIKKEASARAVRRLLWVDERSGRTKVAENWICPNVVGVKFGGFHQNEHEPLNATWGRVIRRAPMPFRSFRQNSALGTAQKIRRAKCQTEEIYVRRP